MTISRPIPKKMLKSMFLKVLHEHHRPGGKYSGHGWDYNSIVRHTLAEYFNISPLSQAEIAEGLRAVFELERDGYIMHDVSQRSDVFKVLTDRGKQIVAQSLDDMVVSSIDIDQLLSREELRTRVHDDYLSGDYETAIFKAFKMLEEKARSKANLAPTIIGADLMTRVFNPNGGLLSHPDAQTPAEAEGLHLLMRGAILWFKNPSSHRTVGYANPNEAAHILAFANLLLDIVDQC